MVSTIDSMVPYWAVPISCFKERNSMNNALDVVEGENPIPALSQEDVFQGCHAARGSVCVGNCPGCMTGK